MPWKLAALVAALIAVAAVVALQVAKRRPPGTAPPTGPVSPLRARLAARSDYTVYVGVPTASPSRWARAVRYTADEIITEGARVAVDDVSLFVIVYPNGQVLDMNPGGLRLPRGLGGLIEGSNHPQESVDPADVARGLALVEVRHGPSPASPTSRTAYRTSLTNRSDEPVRVTRFAAFVKQDGRFVISTVTGTWFSADELIAWYGAPADGWIAPGATVADPDNYGGGRALWVYECETRSGRRFLTGQVASRD